ncbi:MAG TPA: DUF2442 domain-containing protein [Actinomycetota bacterium]|nr:DUF2442 domain-containing protein [Actinomycetota bacterium]
MTKLRSIEYLEGYVIRGTLDDGTTRLLDFEPHLWGPVFEPLKDPAFFRKGEIDSESETVVWPNGADVAPEVWERGFPEESSDRQTG